MLGAERAKIEEFLLYQNENLHSSQSQLGDSETSSQLLLYEHHKVFSEAKVICAPDCFIQI